MKNWLLTFALYSSICLLFIGFFYYAPVLWKIVVISLLVLIGVIILAEHSNLIDT